MMLKKWVETRVKRFGVDIATDGLIMDGNRKAGIACKVISNESRHIEGKLIEVKELSAIIKSGKNFLNIPYSRMKDIYLFEVI